MQLESELLHICTVPTYPYKIQKAIANTIRKHLRSLRVCTFTGELRQIKVDEVDLTPWVAKLFDHKIDPWEERLLDPKLYLDNYAERIASVLAEMRLLEIIK